MIVMFPLPVPPALHALMATVEECMQKKFIRQQNVQVVSMAIWGMVHGLVSLQIRSRFNKIDDGKNIKSLMLQSINWLLVEIDIAG